MAPQFADGGEPRARSGLRRCPRIGDGDVFRLRLLPGLGCVFLSDHPGLFLERRPALAIGARVAEGLSSEHKSEKLASHNAPAVDAELAGPTAVQVALSSATVVAC